MELLRRALLIGCLLPAVWLSRLAPLDPLVSITPIDFAAQQVRERAALDTASTEAQRRRASLPLSVYIEEFLQYNVFSATGPAWEKFLAEIDYRAKDGTGPVFLRADAEPMSEVADRFGAAGGTTYISVSRAGGDVHYRVDRHVWTRQDFGVWSGFGGAPLPPASLLYPFRVIGLVAAAVGVLFFFLLATPTGAGSSPRLTTADAVLLAIGLICFAVPLVAVGGSVQALTRAPLFAGSCWIAALAAMHRFAAPARHAPHPLTRASADRALFLREGFVFLLIAFGPAAFLVSASLLLWNR